MFQKKCCIGLILASKKNNQTINVNVCFDDHSQPFLDQTSQQQNWCDV